MKTSIILFASLFLAIACNRNQQVTQTNDSSSVSQASTVIDQPIKDLSPGSESFTFKNNEGLVTSTKRGTYIMVPENAFVLEDGSPATGEVSIEFKEVFTASEIILSGIPMNAKNNGTVTPFISDGMFTIQAGCGSQKAKLAEGKSIAVSTVSNKQNKDFDYWFLNEKSGDWENIGSRESTVSEDAVIAQAESLNPVQAKNLLANPTIVNSMPSPSIEDLTKDKISDLKKKKPLAPLEHNPKDFVFNLAADYETYPELSAYKNVLWRPDTYLSDKDQNTLRMEIGKVGANVTLECLDQNSQIYQIGYGKKTIKARPVFIGSDKAKATAMYKAKMKAYNREFAIVQEEQKNKQKAAEQYSKTYSMFAVTQMGVYNCDRFYADPGVRAQFTFKLKDRTVDQYVFAVLADKEGVIALSAAYQQNGGYMLPASKIIGFVHTSPSGAVYACKHESDKPQPKNDLELSFRKSSLSGSSDLQAIIDNL